MYKIRKITFREHSVLGNLSLDFCDSDGNAVDTVIFAGENGTGKSTIMNALYMLIVREAKFEAEVEYQKDAEAFTISYTKKPGIDGVFGNGELIISSPFANKYPMSGIYSDVDINFHSKPVSSVTSLNLDEKDESRRSSNDLPTQINQLLIDIQALDDTELARAARRYPEEATKKLAIQERMPRFTTAFNRMFDGLTYSHVENREGHKCIIFCKNGIEIPIDALSSGEKQIVYRGCFLLKDANAINGAFVFIDEPEISLHPVWQMKVMDYYKNMFTSKLGTQTSQIFAVTHSPFIIHNEGRRNDKILVLARDTDGCIIVKDKPEYFKCTSVEAVQDAFSIHNFSAQRPTVYLEGRTDEKYFNKALEVYGYNVPFEFKWVGYIKDGKTEENTGKDALNKAVQFLAGRNLLVKNVCLYDCDTNKPETEFNNVITLSVFPYKNAKGIRVGIENALVLDDIDIEPYKKQKIEVDGYGIEKRIPEFQKMKCCDYICGLDTEILKNVFSNLKMEIDRLITIFDKT